MSSSGSLAGRRALVTGGGRGIGRAIALALAREGAEVGVAARTVSQVEEVAALIRLLGARSVAMGFDVTQPEGIAAMVAGVTRDLGGIDILVNCAGGAESAPFARTDFSLWERMISANLHSVFLCTRAFLPRMMEQGWGRVVNVASRAGLSGYAYVTAYCAAKHGVVGLTRALALEVESAGVTVNAICPGYVDTAMTRDAAHMIAGKTKISPEEALARLGAQNPQGRMIEADEVAAAAVRLALPASAGINGQTVEI